MKCYALAHVRQSIPYIKELRTLFPSVTAVILAQQLDYWFHKYPNGFYKFLEPADGRSDYKPGDSWVEELAFSKAEFRSAFDKVGIRYNSYSDFKKQENPFVRNDGTMAFYCSVHNRRTGQTKYFRNHYFLDAKLIEMFSGKQTESLEVKKVDLCKSTKSISRNKQIELPYTETTTETTNREKDPPITPQGGKRQKKNIVPDSFISFWEQYPRKTAKPNAIKAWKKLKPSDALKDKILQDLSWRKQNDPQWLRDGGQFIPHPATYLNGQRWEDERIQAPPPGQRARDSEPDYLALSLERYKQNGGRVSFDV